MWAKKYEKCIRCGTTEMPHFGKGHCRRCYYRVNDNLQISKTEINKRIGETQKEKRASKHSVKEQLSPVALKDLYLVKEMSFGDISKQMSSRYNAKAEIGKMQTNDTMGKLIAYWQSHRHFDANMADLARYAKVSRDTVYRWLNRKAQPGAKKDKLIQEWLNQKTANF